MKAPVAIVSVCLLGTVPLAAQSGAERAGVVPSGQGADQRQTWTIAINQSRVYDVCPVSMRAQHLSDGNLAKIRNAHPRGIGQGLRLTLVGPDSRRIASATLTVRGVTPKGRVMQASAAHDGSSDAATTLTVAFTAGPGRADLADLWVPGMSAVQAIELKALVYADGSAWALENGLACRVTPDPLMLITSR